ncbi:beta-N-acetylhexosaminidase [Moraxella sp. ZY200743]|uniref:beta-N-acetylhexosaminidase n=1 Tax=Moraxella sp. ZY200743 TaxID=2911970 RepID=UPI003D7DC2AB
MATGIIMADIDGLTLTDEDKAFLAHDALGGVILFKRNVADPAQVRALTDGMRAVNPNLIIAADQEGGRVARFKDGFTPLPAMGRLGDVYDKNQELALSLAYDAGYLMACEVLAVGVDISFAPVLDINGCSLVIGDRAFHANPQVVTVLSSRFIDGMNDAGMKATGKHFPGHGSIAPDSHISDAVDTRCFDEIWACDLVSFRNNLAQLCALMPAHVIFSQIDDKPASFSKVWLQHILREKLGYDGVLFSDDLSMKAAHVAGDVTMRVKSAIEAGCDMALVCNSRDDALRAVEFAKSMPDVPNRFTRMKSAIPVWQTDLVSTCRLAFDGYERAKANIHQAFFADETIHANKDNNDPTNYTTSTSTNHSDKASFT